MNPFENMEVIRPVEVSWMNIAHAGMHKQSIAPFPKAPRVLIVEDSLLIGMELENILLDCGCDVSGICSTLEEALKYVARDACDLALVDYWLADATAEALIEALRRKSIPFVMCTGQSESEFSPELAGAAVVSKPYAVEDIQNAIVRAVSKIGASSRA